MFNKVILIGRLGQNAEAKTAQNNKEYVILNIATQESWKNDKGDYETRTEWHRVYAWRNLSKFAKTLQKGQLITLEGTLRYREVEDEIEGTTLKHRISEIHAITMKRLSKSEAADDPAEIGLLEQDGPIPIVAAHCLSPMALSRYAHRLRSINPAARSAGSSPSAGR